MIQFSDDSDSDSDDADKESGKSALVFSDLFIFPLKIRNFLFPLKIRNFLSHATNIRLFCILLIYRQTTIFPRI